MLQVHIGFAFMRQFQCVPTAYVFSINEFFTISFFKTNSQPPSFIQRNDNLKVEMNNFSCSLPYTWMAIIFCPFYVSGSLSWDVSWEYIAKLLFAWLVLLSC